MRLHHKPLVNWIWGGCVLMALGGLLAVMDRRYRARRVAATKPAAARAGEAAAPGELPLLVGRGQVP